MAGILLWGTGLCGRAEETSPDLLSKAAPPGVVDILELSPWFDLSIVREGPKSRCWVSSQCREGPPLIITGSCSSSLDLAWHFHRMGILPVWGSVLSHSQWAGRGQFGRVWLSPPGNIYAAWRLPNPPRPWADMLSLVVGYMIIRGLMSEGISVRLKWPNDLVIDRKKVGGILIEAKRDAIIAGVGINLVSSPEKLQLDDPLALPPISLKAAGYSARLLDLWNRLVLIGQSCCHETIFSGSPERFISYLQPHLAFMGEEVTIDDHRGAGLYRAETVGLDRSGGLLIRVSSGRERVIHSGKIYP
ncbi:MAG: biotin--[acetyl-CoA-carboxylase] ligase [bacterium]